MPKQSGPIILKGTLGNTTFYTRKGKHLARAKSSLNKARVSTDPAFKNSRKASALFANAAKLAKEIYWQLPPARRRHGIIGKLTGKSLQLLRQGRSPKEVAEYLVKLFP